ncbi:MAG TPA: hypothetical protein VIV56_16815 [Gemmatimonadales bacterium]
MLYQPKTGERCGCLPGVPRDNCPRCEGTGWVIDFQAIHRERRELLAQMDQMTLLAFIARCER